MWFSTFLVLLELIENVWFAHLNFPFFAVILAYQVLEPFASGNSGVGVWFEYQKVSC